MTMETRCFKVIFPKYSKKRNRLKIRSYRRYGEHGGKKMFIFLGFFFTLLCLYAAELALSRWKLSTRWSKTAHATIGLRSRHRSNPRPTRFVSGKAGECRWRPRRYRVIRGLGGEKLPAALNALLPNLKKGLFFAIGEGSRIFVACFLPGTQQRPNVFVSDAWPTPATYHRSFCERCDRWVGRP